MNNNSTVRGGGVGGRGGGVGGRGGGVGGRGGGGSGRGRKVTIEPNGTGGRGRDGSLEITRLNIAQDVPRSNAGVGGGGGGVEQRPRDRSRTIRGLATNALNTPLELTK